MIKILRKKFIRTAMLAVTVLLILLLGAINLINLGMVQRDLKDTLQMVADRVDKPDNDLVNTAYFLVKTDDSGKVASVDVTHVTDVDEEQAAEYALKVYEKYAKEMAGQGNSPVASGEPDAERPLPQTPEAREAMPEENSSGNSGSIPDAGNSENLSGKETDPKTAMRDPMNQSTGRISGYLYLAHPDTTGQGMTDIIFLDPRKEEVSCLRVFALSAGLGIVCLLGMYLFVRRLSHRAIEPIAESMEKQRQFITDAGHELKTPLAIILSNTEAMELYQGESKWSRNIREQVGRLDGLTKNLLMLSRMEEYSENVARERMELGELAQKMAEPFREPLALRGITLRTELAEKIQISAGREQIERLLSVLLENALKYASDNGEVVVSLQRKNDGRKSKAVLKVENTCTELPAVPPEALFERFRRGDEARTRKKGGYGIGLAVAKACAEANGGSIRAVYEEPDRICFEILLDTVPSV